MSIKKMTKEELETLSYKDITYLILEDRKTTLNTKELFERIIKLLDLDEKVLEDKIAEYYTSLSTDKRFILLKNGNWDLRNRHKSDKLIMVDEDDEDEEETIKKEEDEIIEEDSYDDTDDKDDYTDTNEDLKDLVVIEEDELELEE